MTLALIGIVAGLEIAGGDHALNCRPRGLSAVARRAKAESGDPYRGIYRESELREIVRNTAPCGYGSPACARRSPGDSGVWGGFSKKPWQTKQQPLALNTHEILITDDY